MIQLYVFTNLTYSQHRFIDVEILSEAKVLASNCLIFRNFFQ